MALDEPTPRGKRRPFISAVIPALNEEETVGEVVTRTLTHVDEALVIDDGSEDDTSVVATEAGARVLRNPVNRGLMESLRRGFREARGDLIVTLTPTANTTPMTYHDSWSPSSEGRLTWLWASDPSCPTLARGS